MKEELKQKLIEKLTDNPTLGILVGHNPLRFGNDDFSFDGLIADFYLKEKGEAWGKHEWGKIPGLNQGITFHYTALGHTHSLHPKILEWAGIKSFIPIASCFTTNNKDELIKRLKELN